jgi:Lrp/AsnC family leucine-responsive transcriptional regulator
MIENLDETDIRILQLLQENARLTNYQIGEKLNKTATPILVRIRKLEEMGFIKGYMAVLNHEKIGRSLMAFIHVQIRDHSLEDFEHFEREMIGLDEVLECYHMTGEYDFILRVAVKDLKVYHDFLMNKLFKTLPKIKILTTLVMREAKREAGFPLPVPREKHHRKTAS